MKVEFSGFPKAFGGNVAVFVGADKQLQATARAIDGALGGAVMRAIEASRFTGAKSQTLTVLGQANYGRLTLLGVGKPRELDARAAEALGGLVVADANARASRQSPSWSIRSRATGWRRPRSRRVLRWALSFAPIASTSTRPRRSPSR